MRIPYFEEKLHSVLHWNHSREKEQYFVDIEAKDKL
jgi:hypothetical protein